MIKAVVDALYEQFSFQFGPIETAPLHIKFDRYVYWLETKLSSISCAELSELDSIIDQLFENIVTLKGISTHCRATMITYNTSQVNRIHKLYDQIDSLAEPYLSGRLFVSVNGGKYSITSLLPDSDVLKDMIVDNKAKLKSIEEIAASKKTDVVKFKPSKLSTSNRSESKKANEMQTIRNEVKNIFLLLEQLSVKVEAHHSVLKYFGQLKLAVHFPLQALSTHLRSLPPLAETSAQLDHDLQALNKVDAYYTMLRRADVLVQAAVITHEAGQIEALVRDSTDWIKLLSEKEFFQLIYDASKENFSPDNNLNWTVHLRKFCQLPLTDLLSLCGSEEGGAAFQSCVRNLRGLLAAYAREDKNHLLVTRIPSQVPVLLASFDEELFCAHAQDYCERRSQYETIVKRVEFVRAYEQLCSERVAFEKARRKYERTSALFDEYLALHRDANFQLAQLKDRCIEIALTEVSESIEFIA